MFLPFYNNIFNYPKLIILKESIKFSSIFSLVLNKVPYTSITNNKKNNVRVLTYL